MSQPLAIAGIQARMSSTRLPGKMLADLAGKPLVQRVYERALASELVEQVFVLTSSEASDDRLAEACGELGIPCRRGSLADVMSRYEALVDEFDPRYLVRITGDCPLLEPGFIDLQIEALRAFDGDFTCIDHGAELVGSLGGQTVMSARAFRDGARSQDPLDREHVASFFFRKNTSRYRYVAGSVDDLYRAPNLRLSVDEPQDLELIQRIYAEFSSAGTSTFALAEVLRWLAQHPEVSRINGSVVESRANQELRAMPPGGEIEIVGRWPRVAAIR